MNPTNHSSDSIFAEFKLGGSPKTVPITATRFFDSSSNSTFFSFQKQITQAGTHLLYVTNQEGVEIGSSPYIFNVVPSEASASHCTHSLMNTYKLDTSSSETDRTLTLKLFLIDRFNNTAVGIIKFQLNATLGEEELYNDFLSSGETKIIVIPEGSTGEIVIVIRLNGEHIKGSPHYIEAFVPRSEVLDSGTAVTAVLGAGAFLFLSFIVYKAATKKGRENVMDEVTEARKCMLPLVLDLVDIATDVGE